MIGLLRVTMTLVSVKPGAVLRRDLGGCRGASYAPSQPRDPRAGAEAAGTANVVKLRPEGSA